MGSKKPIRTAEEAVKEAIQAQLYGDASTDQNATTSSKSRLAIAAAKKPVAGLWRPPYTVKRKTWRRPGD